LRITNKEDNQLFQMSVFVMGIMEGEADEFIQWTYELITNQSGE